MQTISNLKVQDSTISGQPKGGPASGQTSHCLFSVHINTGLSRGLAYKLGKEENEIGAMGDRLAR
jgi:hypothetical protein